MDLVVAAIRLLPPEPAHKLTVELAARFGIDIRSKLFWEQSLAVIARRVERYARL